ncbi:hypothetical protein POTOM_040111 [Populus tomentosa]|uniref:Uncharacterized protein n=1 Tax=Populus tomentosa TaxID=118781 RepID=A0A8X7YTB1_POPTO|nr:hypothetical protein POTOM_040111 [Populus tomentosa]
MLELLVFCHCFLVDDSKKAFLVGFHCTKKGTKLQALAFFGGFGSYLGGSPIRISAVRILLGGWIAMAITLGLLKPFDKDHS